MSDKQPHGLNLSHFCHWTGVKPGRMAKRNSQKSVELLRIDGIKLGHHQIQMLT